MDETPAGLLGAAMATDAARPLITFYGPSYGDTPDASAARVELSVATFDNWVAKTANFLVDGLAAEPGEQVALLLPLHWQTAAWLLACWSAGLVAAPVAEDASADAARAAGIVAGIVAAGPDRLDAALAAGAPETVGVSLHPLGAPMADPLPGIVDYAAEVRGHGDRFVPYQPVDPSKPALRQRGRELSGGDLAGASRAAAARWELTPADRVLTAVGFDTLDGLLVSLLAPLAAGASLVFSPGAPAEDVLARRVEVERITAVAGIAASGLGCRHLHILSKAQ